LEDRCLLSGGFTQINLASDVPGLARVTDPNLVNPWGISFSPTGPFWLADNGSGVSDLLDGGAQPVPLLVTVPSATAWGGTPTGVVFNGGNGFLISENGAVAPSRFLFATQDGIIAGWNGVVESARALLVVDNSATGATYTGLALAGGWDGRSFLYAADFSHGTIDVFDSDFRPVGSPNAFQDPNMPAGFAPFNIQTIDNLLYVTYAQQDDNRLDAVSGSSLGFIDVYDTSGTLVRHFASQGPLNAPWGLAVAPADFGPFSGALLVGNNGDGLINAYNPQSGAFLGQLSDDNGSPITIPNLWALSFGNGHAGGDSATLFFAAGVNYSQHGLFGAIQSPTRRGMDTRGSGVFDPNAPGEPGDYPLPPAGGPAFRAGNDMQPTPTADLAPLSESSLVLLPTFSSLAPPSSRIEATVPTAPTVAISFGGSATGTIPVSGSIVFIASARDSQPVWSDDNAIAALNTFFEGNAAVYVPPARYQLQLASSNRQPSRARDVAVAELVARAEEVLAQSSNETVEIGSWEKQGAVSVPPPGRRTEVQAGTFSDAGPESTDDAAAPIECIDTQDGNRWLYIAKLVVVTSIPVVWANWLRQMMKFRKSARKDSESSRAQIRPQPGHF
jgi:uncharacterized protein (TIGR03118 family)